MAFRDRFTCMCVLYSCCEHQAPPPPLQTGRRNVVEEAEKNKMRKDHANREFTVCMN